MVDKVDEKVDVLVVDGGLAKSTYDPWSLHSEQVPQGTLPGYGRAIRARAANRIGGVLM